MNTLNISIILIISVYIILNYKNKDINKFFNNNIFKIFILFLMVVLSNYNITISLLIGIVYVLTIQNNINELFSNCLYGSKITECPIGQQIVNSRGLKPYCGDPHKD